MNLKEIKRVYLLGIGGIGMSALARFFNTMGKAVSGYDKTPTPLTDELIAEGIDIHFKDNVSMISSEILTNKESALIIYTPAIPSDHNELNYFLAQGYNLKKRSEVLGWIASSQHTIAVAGTHGKTTTSSLVAHIFKTAKKDITAFLGGITQNYNTNLILSEKSEYLIAEADEYGRSFLTLFPEIAVITSVDPDHLDIYGSAGDMVSSYLQFASQVKKEGTLIVNKKISSTFKGINHLTYSLTDSSADIHAEDLKMEKGYYYFDLAIKGKQTIQNIHAGLPGIHNAENAVGAAAAALSAGVAHEFIKEAISTYKGVKRRFEFHINTRDLVYIDDYAHHPEEIKAFVNSVRAIYPDKKITGIFQPHLFSRTRDFADGFADSLNLLDEVILLDIYPAREKPIPGITSEYLLGKINKSAKNLVDKNSVVPHLNTLDLEVILTIGAGDIDQLVEPIKTELLKRKK